MTNQIIIGKDVEIEDKDYFLNCEGKEYIEGVNYKNYNLKNPDKSFQLKKLEVLGHGLFSKHFIEKGWFNPALLSWLDLFSLN